MMRHLSIVLFAAFVLVGGPSASAQDSTQQSTRKWYVPDVAVAQYAGSIGFVSVGAGYSVFHDKAYVDLLFGYVLPSQAGGESLETLTLKFTAAPWKTQLDERTEWRPLTIGTFFNYTMGRQYSSDLPGWYPSGYYWWSEAVRVNIFIGGNISRTTPRWKRVKRAALYYELGTNEIKFVSYVQNTGYLNIWQILHAGIGVRAHF
jgi:hypothetical protein